jgi:hypothetical protein
VKRIDKQVKYPPFGVLQRFYDVADNNQKNQNSFEIVKERVSFAGETSGGFGVETA